MNNERQIIYVDAGTTNSENYRISLYDTSNNATNIMELSDIKNSTEAEKYAIFYAILYIYKNQYTNCMILCDNKGAVDDKIINALSKECKIKISWIPREINSVADKTCKLDTTLKMSDFYMLDFYVHLSRKAYSSENLNQNLQRVVILQQEIAKLKQKIQNQATQLTNLKNNHIKLKQK